MRHYRPATLLNIILMSFVCLQAWAADPTVTVLYSFTGYADGSFPTTPVLIDGHGLFGANEGGTYDGGTIFEVSPSGTNWTENTIHTFGALDDGASPWGQLIRDPAGNIYGTTAIGGDVNCPLEQCGTVFRLSRNPDGSWTETQLHTFNGYEGEEPFGGVIFDNAGNLWGATAGGGTIDGKFSNFGTIYMLDRAENWRLHTIYVFQGGSDGSLPQASLNIDKAGNIWGTTSLDGTYGYGTVFELTRTSGSWTLNTIYEFTGGSDGGSPAYGQLTFDPAGNIYGTTLYGGDSNCSCGTVFQLANSNGRWQENVLHSFSGIDDGRSPLAGPVFDREGRLYGTTSGDPNNYGNVFRLIDADGVWKFDVVYNFDFFHGANPYTAVTIRNSVLYGTTTGGGELGAGTVYSIAP